MHVARKAHGLGVADHKAYLAEITQCIIEHLCKEGYSAEFVKKEMHFFVNCYFAVMSEAGIRSLSEIRRCTNDDGN